MPLSLCCLVEKQKSRNLTEGNEISKANAGTLAVEKRLVLKKNFRKGNVPQSKTDYKKMSGSGSPQSGEDGYFFAS